MRTYPRNETEKQKAERIHEEFHNAVKAAHRHSVFNRNRTHRLAQEIQRANDAAARGTLLLVVLVPLAFLLGWLL